MNGSKKAKKLSSLPQVKTRSKKLEEQERAKRDRATKKKDPPKEKPKTSGENDGSKEGRKAERERRREEHRASNPDYKEKTPEEKAENGRGCQEMEHWRRGRWR